jgi:hypothetical protein
MIDAVVMAAIAGHGGSESDIGLQRFRFESAIIESAGASWQNREPGCVIRPMALSTDL